MTKTDYPPIPRIDECIDFIRHIRYISKFELLNGIWQVPLIKRPKEVPAFAMPDGLYQYLVILFRMKNASAIFQRMINSVIAVCYAFIDDMVVYSDTSDKQLKGFLCRLQT